MLRVTGTAGMCVTLRRPRRRKVACVAFHPGVHKMIGAFTLSRHAVVARATGTNDFGMIHAQGRHPFSRRAVRMACDTVGGRIRVTRRTIGGHIRRGAVMTAITCTRNLTVIDNNHPPPRAAGRRIMAGVTDGAAGNVRRRLECRNTRCCSVVTAKARADHFVVIDLDYGAPGNG